MKLLIYCYEYPPIGGGAGNALAHLARLWSEWGHEVTVVTSHYGTLPTDDKTDGVRVLRLKVGRRSLSRGRIPEMIRYMMQSRSTCEAVYRRIQPDLAVAFITLPSGFAPMRLKHRFNLPFVTELRGGDVPGFLPNLLGNFHRATKTWIRSIWDKSALVIANSEGLARLAGQTLPRMRVRVVPNGVDTRVFKPLDAGKRAGAVSGGSRCRCVFAGRMVDGQKRISRLIEAVSRQPGLELTLIGAGPDEDRMKELAASRQVRDRVRFLGWLKGEALVEELRSSDLYVSASAWEGMSNSALEAMSCGLPLVLSRIWGHQELVEEGANGYLFDPDSDDELAARLSEVAADRPLRIRMGASSRERAVRDFDWTQIAARHLELYREALSA